MPYLCACLHPEIQELDDESRDDRVTKAVNNAAEELNQKVDEMEGVDKTFEAYGPNDHYWVPSKSDLNEPTDRSVDEEKEYLRSFARALEEANHKGQVAVSPADIWIIVDGHQWLGYGRGGVEEDIYINGQVEPLTTGRALSLETTSSPDPNKLTRSIIKHNIGHCIGLDGRDAHRKGTYRWDGDVGLVADVTPMATSYIRAGAYFGLDYDADTALGGGGETPEDFHDGKDNWIGNEYCGYSTNWCRHDTSYSEAAKEEIVSRSI